MYGLEDETEKRQTQTLYLGPKYSYTEDQLQELTSADDVEMKDSTHEEVVELLTKKNIVTIFPRSSENGPRAWGNRSILFDP